MSSTTERNSSGSAKSYRPLRCIIWKRRFTPPILYNFVCVHARAHMCVCVYVCTCVCVFVCAYMSACVSVCVHVCVYAYMYKCKDMCACEYASKYYVYVACTSTQTCTYALIIYHTQSHSPSLSAVLPEGECVVAGKSGCVTHQEGAVWHVLHEFCHILPAAWGGYYHSHIQHLPSPASPPTPPHAQTKHATHMH